MPFSIEAVSPERALIRVSLMIPLAIQAFEHVRAWLFLFCFKYKRISFWIYFAISSKVTMVLRFVRTIAFNTPRTLYSTRESGVTPLSTILILEYF